MAIQRWDPERELKELQRTMNRMFDDAFARSAGPDGDDPLPSAWRPPTDLFENDDQYVLRADLPGVAAGDVEIKVENGKLHLRGERKMDSGIAQEAYLRVERPYGRFAVQVALAPSVDRQGIRASHRNGVIEIVLPKRQSETPTRVEISSD